MAGVYIPLAQYLKKECYTVFFCVYHALLFSRLSSDVKNIPLSCFQTSPLCLFILYLTNIITHNNSNAQLSLCHIALLSCLLQVFLTLIQDIVYDWFVTIQAVTILKMLSFQSYLWPLCNSGCYVGLLGMHHCTSAVLLNSKTTSCWLWKWSTAMWSCLTNTLAV